MSIITRLAILFAAFELSFIGCDARAQDIASCGSDELAQANRDLSTGAKLLSSTDVITSLMGYQLMQAAGELRRVTEARCELPAKRWDDGYVQPLTVADLDPWQDETASDPWDAQGASSQPATAYMTRDELQAAAAVLGVEATPEAVSSALLKMGTP